MLLLSRGSSWICHDFISNLCRARCGPNAAKALFPAEWLHCVTAPDCGDLGQLDAAVSPGRVHSVSALLG